VDGLSQAILLQ
jgi:hypothetical protein